MEIILDTKQIWVIFLLNFKISCKAAETTCNINNAFGPGTTNGQTVQWWLKNFCKGDERLEDEENSDQLLEVNNNQLRASSKLTLLQLHEKLLKNSSSSILRSFGIWSKLVRSVSGYLMSWPKKKKSFWNVVVYISRQQQRTISQLDCDMRWKLDFIWQILITSSMAGPRRSSKSLPKAKLAPKKCYGHCLVVWSIPAFWILVKLLYLRCMLNRSMRCT